MGSDSGFRLTISGPARLVDKAVRALDGWRMSKTKLLGTATIRVRYTTASRIRFWLAFRLMRLAAHIGGFGGVEVLRRGESDPADWWKAS